MPIRITFGIKATEPQDVKWINVAHGADQRRDVMPKVTKIRSCMEIGEFIGQLIDCQLLNYKYSCMQCKCLQTVTLTVHGDVAGCGTRPWGV